MFFQWPDTFAEHKAFIALDANGASFDVSYRTLRGLCQQFLGQLPKQPQLVALQANNDLATMVAYLACLQGGHPILMLDPDMPEHRRENLLAAYQVNWCVEQKQLTHLRDKPLPLDPRLAILLSTSGSTGSPKQVALSYANLQANAQSICDYLPILTSDTTITTLPPFYSYGLSVINSHLLKGAGVMLNPDSVMSRGFWQHLEQHRISSLAGVPYTYQMLLRLGFDRKDLPHLRYITQAGGKLDGKLLEKLMVASQSHGYDCYVMYGQTEATARMAYVAPEVLVQKPATIGKAIPGGELVLKDPQGQVITQAHCEGELYYRGPNIMLGYSLHAADLKQFSPSAELATGDLAYRDDDGEHFIVGRIKRFSKLFGQRVNLDEVESLLRQQGWECYALGGDNQLRLVVKNNNNIKQLKSDLQQLLGIHPSGFAVVSLEDIPRLGNGKPDYPTMLQQFPQASR